ncbi:MAG: hypothetical protein AABX13_05505 [Nanoarchaeota archaeon]
MPNDHPRFHFRLDKKGVDWASPEMLVITMLAILLGLFFLYFTWKKLGGLAP